MHSDQRETVVEVFASLREPLGAALVPAHQQRVLDEGLDAKAIRAEWGGHSLPVLLQRTVPVQGTRTVATSSTSILLQ